MGPRGRDQVTLLFQHNPLLLIPHPRAHYLSLSPLYFSLSLSLAFSRSLTSPALSISLFLTHSLSPSLLFYSLISLLSFSLSLALSFRNILNLLPPTLPTQTQTSTQFRFLILLFIFNNGSLAEWSEYRPLVWQSARSLVRLPLWQPNCVVLL